MCARICAPALACRYKILHTVINRMRNSFTKCIMILTVSKVLTH